MLKRLRLLVLLLASTAALSAQTTVLKSMSFGGLTREYRVYIPAAYNGTQAVPLVLNFHGYTSNAAAQELYGEFRPIADTANFILVHPQGSLINGATGWNNFGLIGSLPDDIGFVSAMIDSLSASYQIDLQRVYATGLSNGGFMSYDLACLLSNRMAAIASVAGGMVPLHQTACNAKHPTPVMQIHGDADAVVTYNGTGGIIACLSVDSLLAYWVNVNQCNTNPQVLPVPDINPSDLCTAEQRIYGGGKNGSTVEFFKVFNGGHTWPGSAFLVPSNGNTNLDFNASKEIWRFFRQYSLAQLATGEQTPTSEETSFSVYPNPSTGELWLKGTGSTDRTLYISDLSGRCLRKVPLAEGRQRVSLEGLMPGVYLFSLQTEQGWQRKKIVLQ